MSFEVRIKKYLFLGLIIVFGASIAMFVGNRLASGKLGNLLYPRLDSDAPNIVLIVIDTLRADHLSQYGYVEETSPGLDKLASESVIFENAYSTSSWTIPATASIHSGLHPVRHGAVQKGDKLSMKIQTIAEQLKWAGYETVGFSDNIHISTKADFDQGFDTFFDYPSKDALTYPDMSIMMDRARAWVRRHQDAEYPFFVYMQPMNCHGPYKVPESHRRNLLNRAPSRRFKYYKSPMNEIMWKGKLEKRKRVTGPYLKSLVEQYDTAVRYATDQVGQFLSYLAEHDLYEDTMIIVTADHGEELFDHGGFSHGYTLFNEVVRVPLIVKLPQQTASTRVPAIVSLLDIYPTIVSILDVDVKTRLDGHSILPFFATVNRSFGIDTGGGKDSFLKRALLLSLNWKSRGVIRGWVNRKYKYLDIDHDYAGRRSEKLLFHLPNDPEEQHNIGKKKRDAMKRLREKLAERWHAYARNQRFSSENIIDHMNVEALKALGYVQ